MVDGAGSESLSVTISTERLRKARERRGGKQRCAWLRKKFFGARRQQVILTFSGTTLMGVAVVVTVVVYALIQVKVNGALDATAKAHRDALPGGVLQELGKSITPVYQSVIRWRWTAQVSSDWPPLASAYQDDLELLRRLAPLLHTELDVEAHIRHASPDGLRRLDQGFLRTGAALALREDLRTPAGSLEECAAVGVVQLQRDHSGTVSATYQRVVDGGIRSEEFSYDLEASSVIFPAANNLPVMPCSSVMSPVWSAAQTGISTAEDWAWSLDDHGMLSGSLPILSANGSAIGRMFSTQALGHYAMKSMPLLYEKVRDSDWLRNGQVVLYTPTGQVIGQTEMQDPLFALDALPSWSVLRRAISELQLRTGQRCPVTKVSIDTDDDDLIDFWPFMAEDWGMPPFGEGRWCLVVTLPRENLYGQADEAQTLAISAGIGLGIVQFLSTTFLALAVLQGLRTIRAIQQEKLKAQFSKVQSAVQDVKLLNCPMALISAESFLQLQRLEPHESLRNRGDLVILDALEGPGGIDHFREDHTIVFFSHQWVGSDFPDSDDSAQLQAMRGAVQAFQRQEACDREIYVWLDYISIAQRHPKMMRAAVSSLPVYASIADAFVIVAPPAVHAGSGMECNLATYSMRGWCRAEMLAKACGSGLKNFYVCTDTTGELTRITNLGQFSLNVFEGDFTVPTDKESLVQPVLGLYSLVLKAVVMNTPVMRITHMETIHEHIARDKECFFPRSYVNPSGERVELFGPCAELLEGAMLARDDDHEVEALGLILEKT